MGDVILGVSLLCLAVVVYALILVKSNPDKIFMDE